LFSLSKRNKKREDKERKAEKVVRKYVNIRFTDIFIAFAMTLFDKPGRSLAKTLNFTVYCKGRFEYTSK